MKLSADTVRKELSKKYRILSGRISEKDAVLAGGALLNGMPEQTRYVYAASAPRLPRRWKSDTPAMLVIAGNIPEGYFGSAPVDYICVEENSVPTLLNNIQDIFLRYGQYEQDITEMLIRQAKPEEVCAYIEQVFPYPFFVYDASLRVHYVSGSAAGLIGWERDAFTGSRMLPTEFVNSLNLAYLDSLTVFYMDAALLESDFLPFNLICTMNGKSNYIFAAAEPAGMKLDLADVRLVNWIARHVTLSYESSAERGLPSEGLAFTVLSILNGIKFSTADLQTRLSSVGWRPNDNYCCAVVRSQEKSQNGKYINSFTLKIEGLFASCVAFAYKDCIVAVINLTKSQCRVTDIPNRLAPMLRDGLLKAGLSFMYWNFETTGIYYQQACAAFEIGELYNRSEWCYNFENYVMYYFMHYGAGKIPPRHLCHPALVALHRYDDANGTELCRTLETYLANDCNAATTASLLYVHRNTFYQRMNKIHELVNVDLSNPQIKLYLQMSTQLIRMYEYELENNFTFPKE